LRRGEKVAGRSEVSQRVKANLRARPREQFGKQLQEALRDESLYTELTLKTAEYLTPAQRDYVRRTGKLPPDFQFHHLMALADFPEFGDRPETGLGLPKSVHEQAGHGGDPTKPVEALTFQDPAAEDRPGFTSDPQARKGYRVTQEEIAAGTGATPEKQGGVNADLIKERRARIAKLKGRRKPKPEDAARIQTLEKEIQVIEDLIKNKKPPPPAAPPVAAAPAGATPSPGGKPSSGSSGAAVTSPTEQGVSPASATGPNPAEQTAPLPALPAAPATAPERSTPTPQSGNERSDQQLRPQTLGSGSREPEPANAAGTDGTPAPAAPVAHAAGTAASRPPAPVKPPTSTPPSGGGEPPAAEPAQPASPGTSPDAAGTLLTGATAARATSAPAGPVTERVNPAYPTPPGTPEQIVSLRNQVIDTLAVRAQQEQYARLMAKQEKHHQSNEKPLSDMTEKTEQAISATDAHKNAVAHREEANNRKAEEEQKAGDKLEDFTARSAELKALKLPLTGVQKFAGLASVLPDDPDGLRSFKNGMLKMSSDARKFIGKLDEVQQTIDTQKAESEKRKAGVTADKDALNHTDRKADTSKQSLDSAKQTTTDLTSANTERLDQAKSEKADATKTAGTLDAQAKQKQQQADSLAVALQFWGQQHRKARLDGIEQTRKRLEGQGWRVTEAAEA
jgi:hypothetical protein